MNLSNEEILINARERLELTVDDMANLLGTSVEKVKAWEDGSEIIDTADIMVVAWTYKLQMMEMISYLENIKVYSTIPYIKPAPSSNIN